MKVGRLAVSWFVAAAAFRIGVAWADRQADAAARFEQGIKDLQAGNLDRACKELADSNALWPDSGAKGALAECETARGKLASAWGLWHELATSAPTAELRDDAAAHAAQLEPRLPHAVVVLRPAAPAAIRLTFNGQLVNPRSRGAIPVDPGPLIVRAEASGAAPWTHTFQVAEAATIEIDVPIEEHSNARQRRHWIGLSIGGLGLGMVGVGAVFGHGASAAWDRAATACGGSTDRCQSAGATQAQTELNDARTSATRATFLVGFGAAALAAGIIVYVTAPSDERPRRAVRVEPMLSHGAVGLVVSRSL